MFLFTVTGKWSCPAVTGTKPPPFFNFSFTKVDSRRAVVYGGVTGRGTSGDAYVLELDKWVCAIQNCNNLFDWKEATILVVFDM